MPSSTDPVARAIAIAGGPATLAFKLTALGIPTTANGVKAWALVPRNKLHGVAAVSGMPPAELRPNHSFTDDREH